MKNEKYNSCDHEFNIAVPGTVAEFDTLAKKEGAALTAAIDHEVFHGTLGDIREAFADLVAEVYKIPRREIGTGKFVEEDGKKVEVLATEKPSAFIARVAAEKNLDLATKPFAKEAARLSAGGDKEVKFDPSATERKAAGPKKLPQEYANQAALFYGDKSALAKVLKNLTKTLGREVTLVGETDADKTTNLGWLLREYSLVKQKQILASVAG